MLYCSSQPQIATNTMIQDLFPADLCQMVAVITNRRVTHRLVWKLHAVAYTWTIAGIAGDAVPNVPHACLACPKRSCEADSVLSIRVCCATSLVRTIIVLQDLC